MNSLIIQRKTQIGKIKYPTLRLQTRPNKDIEIIMGGDGADQDEVIGVIEYANRKKTAVFLEFAQ